MSDNNIGNFKGLDHSMEAQFFDKLRTNPFVNHNPTADYVELWSAIKTDNNKWQVMQYTIYGLDRKDGFMEVKEVARDVSFMQAVYQLAANEFARENVRSHTAADFATLYPADQYPELNKALQKYYYDLPHYKHASHIEGLIFDQANEPYRRREGIVFAEGTFKLSEISDSVLAVEQAFENNEKFRNSIEGGILSDIYNSVAAPEASFNTFLTIGKVLQVSDQYAAQMGAFYLAIQKLNGNDEKFDRVEGFNDINERRSVYETSQKMAAKYTSYDDIISGLIPEMKETVSKLKNLGVKTEPFEKNNGECELYANLLEAAKNKSALEESFTRVHGVNTSAMAQMQDALERAVQNFIDLGGTEERAGKLRAWVYKPTSRKQIEPSVPAFLTRYYQKRNETMKKVVQRQAGLRDVQTMPFEIKPPLTEDNTAATRKPSAGGPSNG